MITYLPYPDFAETARCLHDVHLADAMVSGLRLLKILLHPEEQSGWRFHSLGQMWGDHEHALATYLMELSMEDHRRGNAPWVWVEVLEVMPNAVDQSPEMPPWIGLADFHISHRAMLKATRPEHYGPIWPEVEPVMAPTWLFEEDDGQE